MIKGIILLCALLVAAEALSNNKASKLNFLETEDAVPLNNNEVVDQQLDSTSYDYAMDQRRFRQEVLKEQGLKCFTCKAIVGLGLKSAYKFKAEVLSVITGVCGGNMLCEKIVGLFFDKMWDAAIKIFTAEKVCQITGYC